MTDESDKDRARERLEQYQAAVSELQYLRDRIETVEAKLLQSTTPPDSSAGWTGQYIGRGKQGQGRMVDDDPGTLNNPLKVRAVPNIKHKVSDPKAGEKLMVIMIDLIVDYERKALAAVQLCQTIESEIDSYCTGNQVNALKYRYIEGLTYGAIARRLMYSERHLVRLIDEGLEAFGLQMRLRSKRCHEMS